MTATTEARLISGGQSGIDRLALDIAIEQNLEHGGWCPAGRRSEWGPIPDKYKLRETESKNYAVRTKRNIADSDGTLVIHHGPATGGTALTIRSAKQQGQPVFCVDCDEVSLTGAWEQKIEAFTRWLADCRIRILNVAGPRASSDPDLPTIARPFLVQAVTQFRKFLAESQVDAE